MAYDGAWAQVSRWGLPVLEAPVHPVLAPASRRLWRDGGTLQLGRSGPAAVVLSGLTESRRAVLALLDGSRSRAQVVAQAPTVGATPAAAEELLALLDGAGLLADAGSDTAALAGLSQQDRDRLGPDVAALRLLHGGAAAGVFGRRREARVLIRGAGRVGAPLSALLAAAGVGTVDVRDDAAVRPEDTGVGGLEHRDIGRPRALAVRDRLRALAPSVALDLRRPDLVVLTEPEDPAPDAGLLVLDGLAHLVARVEDQVGVVGPLVLPGRSSCLHCLDLARTGLDPAWPALAAQLARAPRELQACDGVLATAVAAQAALQILELLAGETTPATLDGTLELTVPGWRWRRRSWPRHPACPCVWERAA